MLMTYKIIRFRNWGFKRGGEGGVKRIELGVAESDLKDSFYIRLTKVPPRGIETKCW